MTYDDTATEPLEKCCYCPAVAATIVGDTPMCDMHARILDPGELGGEG